jgi:hypothetical protein
MFRKKLFFVSKSEWGRQNCVDFVYGIWKLISFAKREKSNSDSDEFHYSKQLSFVYRTLAVHFQSESEEHCMLSDGFILAHNRIIFLQQQGSSVLFVTVSGLSYFASKTSTNNDGSCIYTRADT